MLTRKDKEEAAAVTAQRGLAMERGLHRILQSVGGAGGLGGAQPDAPMLDTSEQVYISSLALLKMLKHGGERAMRR